MPRRPSNAAVVEPAEGAPAADNGMAERLRQAALELFVERGYHGTSMRDIAARAGTSVSHLYYYCPSKAGVLKEMILSIVDDLLHGLAQALEDAGDGPVEQLSALVRAEVMFHCRRREEAFVGRSELRSLREEDRPEVIERYDRVTGIFKDVIAKGVKQGVFDCPHRGETANALLTMCNSVSSWYRTSGRLSPATIADRYTDLALRMVGARAAA